jgi:hypothetical protein
MGSNRTPDAPIRRTTVFRPDTGLLAVPLSVDAM